MTKTLSVLIIMGLLLAGPAVSAPLKGDRITFGLTGGNSHPGRQDPGYLLGQAPVQDILFELARSPLGESDITARLQTADASASDLVDAGIVRRLQDGRYTLGLNFYTAVDTRIVRTVAAEATLSLADEFLKEQPSFDRLLAKYDMPGIDRRAVAMALIGCVVLDWDGLGVTSEDGYRSQSMKHPDGDVFVPWAREKAADISVRALYWGSHNDQAGDVWFTTFGDHDALPRMGIPDVVWAFDPDSIGKPTMPLEVRQALVRPFYGALTTIEEQAAPVMIRLRDGPATADALAAAAHISQDDSKPVIRLLLSLGYIRQQDDGYAASVPVFTARDAPMIGEIRALGRKVMRRWLKAHYAEVRGKLSGITAARAGVPYEQLFTEIWHDLFGRTNYYLTRSGMVIDPYGPDTKFKGFQPFVWEASLKLND